MYIKGIAQPEFKYAFRDKKYKLMEINLRSMVWHRIGNLSGVNLHYSRYLDALGEKNKPPDAGEKQEYTLVLYLKHEIINLIMQGNISEPF